MGLAVDRSLGGEVYGWYVLLCERDLCGDHGGYLVGYKYIDIFGVEVLIWYVDPALEKIYFVNGKAKTLTPELPGAFIEGIVDDVGAAFALFENLPKSAALR